MTSAEQGRTLFLSHYEIHRPGKALTGVIGLNMPRIRDLGIIPRNVMGMWVCDSYNPYDYAAMVLLLFQLSDRL